MLVLLQSMIGNKPYFFNTNRVFNKQKCKKNSSSSRRLKKEYSASPKTSSKKPYNPEQNNFSNNSLMDLQYLDISQYMEIQNQEQQQSLIRRNKSTYTEQKQKMIFAAEWEPQQSLRLKQSIKGINKQYISKITERDLLNKKIKENQGEKQIQNESNRKPFLQTQLQPLKKAYRKHSSRQLTDSNCPYQFKLYNDYIIRDQKPEQQSKRQTTRELKLQRRQTSPSYKNIYFTKQITNSLSRPKVKGPFLKMKFQYDRKKQPCILSRSLQCSQQFDKDIKRVYQLDEKGEQKNDKVLGIIDIKLEIQDKQRINDGKINQIMKMLQKKRMISTSNKKKQQNSKSQNQKIIKQYKRKTNNKAHRNIQLFNLFSNNLYKLKKNRQLNYPKAKFNSIQGPKNDFYPKNFVQQ